jgi:hypothetical protein
MRSNSKVLYFERRSLFIAFSMVALMFTLILSPAWAGDVVLSNNSGSGSTVWFISGERSLIINGFDLNALGLELPVSVDRISISVVTPQPGSAVDAVVYQDANGGSPSDATLLAQQRVDIQQSGLFTVTFTEPVEVTAPVVWVGFYLPVDFEFSADASGSSVLTYWAWTNGAEFDLRTISSAGVLGPSDGTAPVNIDMGGIARITAELVTGGQTVATTTSNITGPTTTLRDDENRIVPLVGSESQNLSAMINYPEPCAELAYDGGDVAVTYHNEIRWFCKLDNPFFASAAPEGYVRQGKLYDAYVFGIPSGTRRLPEPVTHCLTLTTNALNNAVLGLEHGAPRRWEILPTVRFGSAICAEVEFAGHISYFLPN